MSMARIFCEGSKAADEGWFMTASLWQKREERNLKVNVPAVHFNAVNLCFSFLQAFQKGNVVVGVVAEILQEEAV